MCDAGPVHDAGLCGAGLQGLAGARAYLFVLCFVLLSVLNHLLNLLLAQAALVVGDGDLALLACA